jgi:hypothetical protein
MSADPKRVYVGTQHVVHYARYVQRQLQPTLCGRDARGTTFLGFSRFTTCYACAKSIWPKNGRFQGPRLQLHLIVLNRCERITPVQRTVQPHVPEVSVKDFVQMGDVLSGRVLRG